MKRGQGVMERPPAKSSGRYCVPLFHSRSGAVALEVFPPGAVGPKIGCVALDAGWQRTQGN